MTGIGPLEIIKLAIYYASYLYFFAVPVIIWLALNRQGLTRQLSITAMILLILFAYARFIEPRRLLTAEHKIEFDKCFERDGAARIAIVSDIHTGIFGNAIDADRIAAKINEAEPDLALFAGDFIYFLHPDEFISKFGALAQITAPSFAVLGNHDLGLPGPDLSGELNDKLSVVGLRMIDDTAWTLWNSKLNIELVGLSDRWARNQKLSLLTKVSRRPRIVLTHNTASVQDFDDTMSADLVVGGHTHGGQINIPFVSCAYTGYCGNEAYGLREEGGIQIFTTSGTGMVGLPLRFRMPPRIDILNIQYRRCSAANRRRQNR
ncbi:MAG: hypothetical protein HKN14_13650 [Marinicaulis sp.]|nr:metallophosphoesterase [Marinicaulis sp.]NNE41951.1 hypothetical protein [Marinicaulis sp.]NNL89382.1 hypothetical protein [Marinicaulis sp.]